MKPEVEADEETPLLAASESQAASERAGGGQSATSLRISEASTMSLSGEKSIGACVDEQTTQEKEEQKLSAKLLEKATAAASFLQPYEPITDDYRADNPSPMLLLAGHLGMAFVEISTVFGGYAFLLSNADVMFPKCSDHPLIDKAFGLHTGHGWLCEISTLMLWTFPLVCCMLIPFFQYWDFCDSRLYYECLRAKMIVEFREKAFFGSPIMVFLFLYLVMGLCSTIFGAADNWDTYANVMRAMTPALLPLISFGVTIFMNWDLRFFLITLANFTAHDAQWAGRHLSECISVPEAQLREVYRKMMAKDRLPVDGDSMLVFGKLMSQTKRKLSDGKHKLDNVELDDNVRLQVQETYKKMGGLLFGQKGYWVTDLLWLPGDFRAKTFRFMFYIFSVGVYVILAFFITVYILTVMQYLKIQGHITDASFLNHDLRNYMIKRP